jgi:fructokinase
MRSKQAGVLLLGEALVDEFADQHVAGGAPFNVARHLAAIGVPALLASRIGLDDAGGQLVRACMKRFGLSEQGLQLDPQHPTGRVSVIEAGGAHRFEIHTDAAWDHLDGAVLPDLLIQQEPDFVYFGSLAQRHPVARASLRSLLALAGEQQRLRYLDLNLREGSSSAELAEASLHLADWVKVNQDELAQLLDWFDAGQAPDGVAGLMLRFELQLLVVTRGEQGYAAFDAQGQQIASGSGIAVEHLADTVGAGDGFSAMLLAATLAGQPLPMALDLANRYASALCSQRGPVPADDGFFKSWQAALESNDA